MTKKILQLLSLDIVVAVLVLFFAQEPVYLLLTFLGASILLFVIDQRDWKLYVSIVFFALIFEPILVSKGAWGYPEVNGFFNVPYWIFLMWGFDAVNVYRFSTYLLKK